MAKIHKTNVRKKTTKNIDKQRVVEIMRAIINPKTNNPNYSSSRLRGHAHELDPQCLRYVNIFKSSPYSNNLNLFLKELSCWTWKLNIRNFNVFFN
jgi:hypothetical protein